MCVMIVGMIFGNDADSVFGNVSGHVSLFAHMFGNTVYCNCGYLLINMLIIFSNFFLHQNEKLNLTLINKHNKKSVYFLILIFRGK